METSEEESSQGAENTAGSAHGPPPGHQEMNMETSEEEDDPMGTAATSEDA